MKLMVILGSSRRGRKGEIVASWVQKSLAGDSRFEVDFVDTRQLNLPFFDEPISPFSMKSAGADYTHPEGKQWAQRIDKIDAIILVTPEYNHGYPAVLKNALDWVGPEWKDKPVSFISYSSSTTGGARGVEQLRSVVTELGLIQVANAIHFPKISEAFAEDGQPLNPQANDALKRMLEEIIRLSSVFK